MSKQKKSIIKNILVWLFSVLLFLGVIGAIVFIIRDTSGDTEDGSVGGVIGGIVDNITGGNIQNKRVAITYNGEVLKDGDNVELPESGQARFEVANGGNYTVQVFPNVTEETDFTFTVDGISCSFLSQGDLREWFIHSGNKTENYFDISCSYEKFTVEGLLFFLYGSGIKVETDIEYPYRLVVTGSDGSSVTVNVKQVNSEKSIKFDTEGDLVF